MEARGALQGGEGNVGVWAGAGTGQDPGPALEQPGLTPALERIFSKARPEFQLPRPDPAGSRHSLAGG